MQASATRAIRCYSCKAGRARSRGISLLAIHSWNSERGSTSRLGVRGEHDISPRRLRFQADLQPQCAARNRRSAKRCVYSGISPSAAISPVNCRTALSLPFRWVLRLHPTPTHRQGQTRSSSISPDASTGSPEPSEHRSRRVRDRMCRSPRALRMASLPGATRLPITPLIRGPSATIISFPNPRGLVRPSA